MGTISLGQLFILCLLIMLLFGDFPKLLKKIKENFKKK